MDSRLRRFRCAEEFFPYLEKVLARLPENIRGKVLDDSTFQILGGDDFLLALGLYYRFEDSIKNLVYLNASVLKEPEKVVIHTMAHEIAHWIAQGGQSGLREKEAEDLVIDWGFKEESKAVKYHRPILESEGYEIGYEWAKKQKEQDLLNQFEEYYADWDQEKLSGERLEMLLYDIDLWAILEEMGAVEHKGKSGDLESLEGEILPGDHSLDKGIAWGIMAAVKQILLKRQSHAYAIEPNDAEFIETVQKIKNELLKLSMLRAYSKYSREFPQRNIIELSINLSEFLDRIKGEHEVPSRPIPEDVNKA